MWTSDSRCSVGEKYARGNGTNPVHADIARRVESLPGIHVASASADSLHSIVVSATGSVFSFANNSYGQLGRYANSHFATEDAKFHVLCMHALVCESRVQYQDIAQIFMLN